MDEDSRSHRSEKRRLLEEQDREHRFYQRAKTGLVVSIYVAVFGVLLTFTIISNKQKEATSPENNYAPAFQELYRPQVHFSPPYNFMNDPNGLVYVKPYYHMFYQYNPGGESWGNMSWGHARSLDLIRWEQLPVAIPIADNIAIFSGSAIVDPDNKSGFGEKDGPAPVIALYTGYHEKTQKQDMNLAYSTDNAETWTKYSKNPVIDRNATDFRDSKVMWYEEGKYWIVTNVLAQERQVVFYKSTDLKNWVYLSKFGPAGPASGVWECPDLFHLPVTRDNGTFHTPHRGKDKEDRKWILTINAQALPTTVPQVVFFVGTFDGKTFTPDSVNATTRVHRTPRLTGWAKGAAASGNGSNVDNYLDYGFDYYAAVSYNSNPDDRVIFMAWLNRWDYANVVPTTPWRGQMAAPRELALHRRSDGTYRVAQKFVRELDSLVVARSRLHAPVQMDPTVNGIRQLSSIVSGEVFRIHVQVDVQKGDGFTVGVFVRNDTDAAPWSQATLISYDRARDTVSIDRAKSGRLDFSAGFRERLFSEAPAFSDWEHADNTVIDLDILVDWCSVEVIINGGRSSISNVIFPDPIHNYITFGANKNVVVNQFDVQTLENSWNPPTRSRVAEHGDL